MWGEPAQEPPGGEVMFRNRAGKKFKRDPSKKGKKGLIRRGPRLQQRGKKVEGKVTA